MPNVKSKKQNKKPSPRQELGAYANGGSLRWVLETTAGRMSEEAIQLCIDVVIRYCEPRQKS